MYSTLQFDGWPPAPQSARLSPPLGEGWSASIRRQSGSAFLEAFPSPQGEIISAFPSAEEEADDEVTLQDCFCMAIARGL